MTHDNNLDTMPNGKMVVNPSLRNGQSYALILFLICCPAAIGENLRIPLQVSEAFENRNLAWPVTLGIPISEGKLKAPIGYRLTDDRGNGVACHVKPVGWWRKTNSVQWATVKFVSLPGRKYSLELGPGLEPLRPKQPIEVTEKEGTIVVQNGSLQTVFGATGPATLHKITVGDTEVLRSRNQPSHFFRDQDGKLHASRLEGEERLISVESRSPLHAVVKCTGFYVGPEGQKFARYTTRYHFYAGIPFFKVSHAFRILVDTENLQFREIVYRLPIALSEEKRIVSFDLSGAFDGKVFARDWKEETRSLSMAQETFRHYGQTESTFRIHEIGKDGESDVLYEGEQGGQYADVATEGAGITVGMKWFWQQFPKEFEVTSEDVAVHLWSARGGTLDFRVKGCEEFWGHRQKKVPELDPTEEEKDEEDTGSDKQEPFDILKFWKAKTNRKLLNDFLTNPRGYDTAKGLEKSHELWLWPRAKPATSAQVAEFGRLIEQPVLAIAEPEWNCESGVFGEIGQRDPAVAPEIETLLDKMLARRREAADAFGDYGWWAFGWNDHAVWVAQDGKLLATSHRFAHATYHQLRSLWALYFRSGDRRILEYLLPRMYQLLDIRTKHVADPRWIKGSWGPHYIYVIPWWTHETWMNTTIGFGLKEILMTWYMTGDDRWREWADDWVTFSRDLTSKEGWLKQYVDESFGGYHSGWARAVTTYLNSMVEAYAYSGDHTLIERSRDLAEAIMDPNEPTGLRRLKDGYLITELFYWLNPLLNYAAQSGDARAVEACRKATNYFLAMLSYGGDDNSWISDLSIGYAMNRQPRFLSEALLNLQFLLRKRLPQLNAQITTRDGARSLIHGSTDKQLWDGLPRLAFALQKLRKSGGTVPMERLLPALSKTIVLAKQEGQELSAELFSRAPLDRVTDAGGRGVSQKWWKSEKRMNRTRLTFYLCQVLIPKQASPGEYLVHGKGNLKLLSSNAPRYAAWVPGPFSIGSIDAFRNILLPAGNGRVSVRVRFPKKVTFENAKGEPVSPTRTQGQRLDFENLEDGDLISLRAAVKGYAELLHLPPEKRWVGYGDAGRFFIPKARLDPPTSTAVPEPSALYVKGINEKRKDDQALYLAAGRTLSIPTRINVEPEELEDEEKEVAWFPKLNGTVEFWYCPLWDPRWKQNPYYQVSLMNAKIFSIEVNGHEAQSFPKIAGNAYGPLNRGWANKVFPFQPGRWYHIAISWFGWDLAKGKIRLMVFIDGQPHSKEIRTGDYIMDTGGMAPRPDFLLAPFLRVGSKGGEALFDELRISDIARYINLRKMSRFQYEPLPFKPTRRRLESDKHTLLLMHFDGDTKGASEKFKQKIEGKIEVSRK